MATQRRAPAGGTIGTNGEFYEGGKFLPSTEQPKRLGSTPRKPRKVEIEPYVWVPAEEDRVPIFGIVGSQAEYIDRYSRDLKIRPFAPGLAWCGPTYHGRDVAELCEAFNRGERWTAANWPKKS